MDLKTSEAKISLERLNKFLDELLSHLMVAIRT